MNLMQKRTLLLVEGGKVVDELREGDEVEYVEANKRDDLVKVEESVKKAELKKAFEVVGGQYVDTTTGEVVPGVSVEEKTSIKVSVEP